MVVLLHWPLAASHSPAYAIVAWLRSGAAWTPFDAVAVLPQCLLSLAQLEGMCHSSTAFTRDHYQEATASMQEQAIQVTASLLAD